ncbi:MAG: hypothetical protein SGJ13_18795 [Actinomycetota bacterium]|nr:hypothetical protein [Actinomycetota bacterium]
MRRSLPFLAAVFAAALVLSACGGDDDDAASDPVEESDDIGDAPTDETDAPDESADEVEEVAADDAAGSAGDCHLTPEQVSEVVGHDMVEVDGQCAWEAADADSGTVLEVYYSGAVGEEFDTLDSAVEGVGDEAHLDVSDALWVKSGDTYFNVQVISFGGELDAYTAQEALAQLILADM